uniref:Serpin domain-containing protein n=1 Tax=Panagrolaimus superbus TaxID=310955 RepID=A0A914Y4D7_9BILA
MFDDEADFAHRLIPIIDDASEKSIIFSPSSILNGLAMFYVGCDGETATEIQQIIGKEFNKNAKENVKVKFANKVYISDICELLPTFCQTIDQKFNGGFQQLDFNNNVAAVLEINNFVKTETNGLIPNMVAENDINKDTAVILVNAVYFKAPWNLLFRNFDMIEFTASNSEKRMIKMMSRKAPETLCWNYLENEKWTSLGIPYENYKAWIYFVLQIKIIL